MVVKIERLHWLVATKEGFDLHTDQKNLIFIFDPLRILPDLSVSTEHKVLRWTVRLSLFEYV